MLYKQRISGELTPQLCCTISLQSKSEYKLLLHWFLDRYEREIDGTNSSPGTVRTFCTVSDYADKLA